MTTRKTHEDYTMLKDDFYTLLEWKPDGNTLQVQVKLNASHKIFEGHFPNQPVVPGVCQLQIITELLADALQKKVSLAKGDMVKYLGIINPLENPVLHFSIQHEAVETGTKVNATCFFGDKVFLKFKGELR